jgi:hypothetical protein
VSAKVYKNGMTHTEYTRGYRENNLEKTILITVKHRAKRRGHEVNIEESDIKIPIICPILGLPIFTDRVEGKKAGPSENSPSLDRIDNTKGYVKGNVQVISHKANTMKGNASPQELIKFANWVIYTYGGHHEEDSTK